MFCLNEENTVRQAAIQRLGASFLKTGRGGNTNGGFTMPSVAPAAAA
jgi:hypothetical protein